MKTSSSLQRIAARYLKAEDITIPSEWFEKKKTSLANGLGSSAPGDSFLLVADKIRSVVKGLQTMLLELKEFARFNPYAAKKIENLWDEYTVRGLETCAESYISLEKKLSEFPGGIFYTFVEDVIRDIFKRAVKNVASALENTPHLSVFGLDSWEATLKRTAPPSLVAVWSQNTLTKEAVDFFKKAKVREKLIRNYLSRGAIEDPLKAIDNLFTEIGKSKYFTPEFYADRGIVRERTLGKAKIVILDPDQSPETDSHIIRNFQKAHALLQKKGLGSVWYGPMLVMNTTGASLTAEEKSLAKAMGYDVGNFSGQYNTSNDRVEFFNEPGEALVFNIAHELGHRYWFRFMDSSQRAWFNANVATTTLQTSAADPSLVRDYLDSLDFLPGEKDDEGYRKPVRPVTPYGRTNAHEAFAEAFAFYVTNKNMDRDQIESLKTVLRKTSATKDTHTHTSKEERERN